jgi:MFS family permease
MVLFVAMMAFIPVFFFASEYAQISLGKSASEAGLYLLYFFIGFVIAAQIGGRMLDRIGAKRPVVMGCILSAVGFYLWAGQVMKLSFNSQQWYIIIAGAGMGLMLGQANTDAVNRASKLTYGEATGITQTLRNYGSSLGLAILGTILISVFRSHLTTTLVSQGKSKAVAQKMAAMYSQSRGGQSGPIPHYAQVDFAYGIRTVLYGMAIVMIVAAVVAFFGLRAGVQEDLPSSEADVTAEVPA